MNLSGTLDDWTIVDLLSMLKVTRKTGTLQVNGQRSGSVHFNDGHVVMASVSSGTSVDAEAGERVATVDALFVLSGLEVGRFELGPYAGPEGDGWDVDELVADMSRLSELELDVVQAGLADRPLILSDSISSALTVQPEDWWAVASLVSVLSLQQLEDVFGRARSIRLLHTLWRLGVTEAIDEITEAEADEADETVQEPEPESAPEPPAPEANRSDETWLDDIAASAAGPGSDTAIHPGVNTVSLDERRTLTGLSAPASTTLTGPVLDEMRRLRGRVGE